MAEIILPHHFRQQPQGAVHLDPSHWFGSRATFAITGAAPDFNAATGRREAITGGGSGFSIRTTIHGKSLYTPDGGWVNFDVGQDWAGPNTIIALCRVNNIDSPWGGLFSKEATSTSTQFAIGRSDSSDSLYGSVANATALSFGAGTILSLEDFCVIAFTHSGAAGTTMSYYRNGVLTGATTALDAQPSGADVLGLGRSRDALATYDSDVDWVAFLRAPFVASAEQIRGLSSNIWSIWKAPKRKVWSVQLSSPSDLTPGAIESVSEVVTPTFTSTVDLPINSVVSTSVATTPALVSDSAEINPNNAEATSGVETPALVPGVVILVPSLAVASSEVTTPALSSGPVAFAPSAASASSVVEVPVLQSGSALVITAVEATVVVSTPLLVVAGTVNLVPDTPASLSATVTPDLTAGGVTLNPSAAPATAGVEIPSLGSGLQLSVVAVEAFSSVVTPTLTAGSAVLAHAACVAASSVVTPALSVLTELIVTPAVVVSIVEAATLMNSGAGRSEVRRYAVATEQRLYSLPGESRNYTIPV